MDQATDALPGSSSSPLKALRAMGREAVAFARLASLIPRDLGRVTADKAREGDDVVVLLHGLFATAGVLRPLRERLEAHANAHTASFTYVPHQGVEALSEKLGELVDTFPSRVRVHLVGHSLGGVIVRWFVQERGGDPRVVQTITMGSPFTGAPRARFMPGPAGSDILPESTVLRRLHESIHLPGELPHLSIAAADDVLAGANARLPVGDHALIDECGHNALLYHPRALDLVTERVRRFSAP